VTTAAEVRKNRVLVCDLCGVATAIEVLPPLLFLTGASGSGKTTIYQALLGRVTEAILIDADLLWGVNPAHDDPGSDYRQFRGLVLHLAERLARNGQAVLVEGSCMPHQYESLGERWYFAKTAYLATVSSDDELIRRLRARPAWRRSQDRLDAMVDWNRHLRERALTTEPPIDILDTTDRSVAECAHEVHLWIKEHAAT
jgi:chloramphenicol 3-O-phosphotransferase